MIAGSLVLSSLSHGHAQANDDRSVPSITEPPRPTASEKTELVEPGRCGEALRVSAGCASVFGLRGSAGSASGVPANDGAGLMVWSDGENYAQWYSFNAHGVHRFALGGGGAGLEGTLLGGFTGGFRVPFGDRHGPVFRAGALGYVQGNDSFYTSLLELPRIEVGYQLTFPAVIFEIGASSGAVLTGRERIGDAYTRQVGGGFEVGGYASARVPWFRMGLRALRLPSADEISTPVRVFDGTLCALTLPIAICGDARLSVADEFAHGSNLLSEARSSYAGLAVGFTANR
jgi:hypothetical protein